MLKLKFIVSSVCIAFCTLALGCASEMGDDVVPENSEDFQTAKGLAYVVPGGSRSAIAGNNFLVAVVEDRPVAPQDGLGSSLYGRVVTVRVSYADSAGYFRGAPSMKPYMGILREVRKKSGQTSVVPEHSSLTLAKLSGRNLYEGAVKVFVTGVAGDSSARLKGLALAFLGDGRWDSNNGKNYVVDFPQSLQSDANDKTARGVLGAR